MMGSQNPTASDRTRVNWTATMERYFIDLMLDQLHKGNRLGHTFNKQAWTDMMTVFNAKFRTKYDRDTLKTHYSILWKQYNDVKNLLDQNGFCWDDVHKMVIADGRTWDAFIKAYPDMQAYRNRALIHFSDLCFIYAYTQADGRYSLSSHDVNVDDVQVLNTVLGIEIVTVAQESLEPTKTDWTPEMDQYLIELMLDQRRKGNKRKNTFSKQAWTDMLMLLNVKFGSHFRRRFLRHRYKKLFKYYAGLRSLLQQKGFTWDEKQQIIVADDITWDKYIKAHPDARSYRKKTLLNYRDLCSIYGKASSNGPSVCMRQDKSYKDNILQAKTGEEMEGHSSAGSEGLRTHWTPSMDRYLIDLLLDHALRGNKIGPTFSNEAWTEMVTVFYGKFGSHYDIDVLKSRYKHLRRNHNDIKILLEQSGFFWDDNREMVIAEDYVWDSYTKAHPDAEVYRNKSVPSYHKLCVIYDQESSYGTSSHLAHNVDQGHEVPDLIIGEELQYHANRDCSRTDWSPLMDRYLIDLMLEQVHKGSRTGCSFHDEAWIDMAVSFVERYGLQHDKDLLRVHHKSLGKQYNDMKNLLEHGGFSWDEKQQMVTACGNVWDAYIKEHPGAKYYRTKPTANFNDLCLIYGKLTSDRRDNQSCKDLSCNGDGPNNNGCCRSTDWTPPMDRYFIDLMLEQVRHGCIIDQKFSKQAWVDMVAKFREEFGSQHNKDVLKSRFMNLRKRFNDMRNLLEQSGFAWDEMKQMIIADYDLWDAYVKEHPDARSYRGRTLPNFNDLFLIYGNTKIDAGQHYFSHSTDTGDYVLGIKIGEDADQFPNYSDLPRMHWTRPMERYFIDLMLEQVHRGNKIGHTFNEQAWAWMIALFNEKFGLLCDREALEQRYFSLMNKYHNITDLNQNSFVWDNIQQSEIDGDDVCEGYIKEHTDANTYRERVFSFYNDLDMIYGTKSPVAKSSSLGIKTEIDNDALDTSVDNIFSDLHTPPAAEFDIPDDQRKKRKSTTSSTSACSRKVQRPVKEEMHEILDEVTDYSSIESIVDALQAVPDMDDELFLEACQLLENERKAKMFIEMNIDQRRKWLLRKLRGCQ